MAGLPLALGALAVLWLAMLLLGAGPADRDLLLALYAADAPWLALAALGFTWLGNWSTLVPVTIAGALLLLLWKRDWRDALLLLAVTFGGRVLVIAQKDYFDRLRPEENLRSIEVHYQSFPSGHAANSMMVYLSLALLFSPQQHRWAWAAVAVAVSLLVGLSRPMLGVHWPSDVVGGWAMGLLWTLLLFRVAQTLNRNSRTSPSWTT